MRTGADGPLPGVAAGESPLENAPAQLTDLDCDIWAHVIARWWWWAAPAWTGSETQMQLFRLSRAADRRDALIMSWAQANPEFCGYAKPIEAGEFRAVWELLPMRGAPR